MTSYEFPNRLPTLTNDPLPIKPPFEFTGLSTRVFPLRANLDALQQFTNDYLNFVPPEVGRFRAVVPYVYLALLDYGQIAEETAPLGWFAQVEVFFCVPLEWYKVVNGRWVFHDWAVCTPFIYVNDDLSVPMGRIVYGFPKTLAHVTETKNPWLRDPMAPVTVARVKTAVFPTLYQGKRLEQRVFLEVERQAPMSNFRIPVDARSPIAPWMVASNLAQTVAGFSRDAMWLAQSMRIFPIGPGTDPAFIATMMERLAVASGGSGFVLNSLNLKQFPRSEEPGKACYQGLTNGRMQGTALNGAGLLGEEATFVGDLSGGYTIKLHEYSSLPIARTLGLEVYRRWQGDGVEVASFKPVMPFWLNVNVRYQQGMTLAWQTRDGIWRGGDGEPLDASQRPVKEDDAPKINTSVRGAVDAITGPFRFENTTIRVLPLLAKRKKLEEFLKRSINDALGDPVVSEDGRTATPVQLSLWTRCDPPSKKSGERDEYAYIYMTASSFGAVTSKTNNVGDWADYEISIVIPVKWQRMGTAGKMETVGVGVVPAFTFVDDTLAAVARGEVLGIPTSRATFVKPESAWLGEQGDVRGRQTLLCVKAEVIPAVGVGQQTAMHPVIEISQHDPETGFGEIDSLAKAEEWSEILLRDLKAKKTIKKTSKNQCNVARALALEVLANRAPVSLYTLKQFRDCADPAKACYQSLVRVPRMFEEVTDIQETEEMIRIRFHDFPTLKLVESLGIWAKAIGDHGSGLTYATQAIRPFYIQATVEEPFGERLLSRAGRLTWTLANRVFESRLTDEKGRHGAPQERIEVDRQAEVVQDQGNPSEMHRTMASARRRRKHRAPGLRPAGQLPADSRDQVITAEEATDALDVIDPQMVIESILSREWGSTDENARWRRGRRDLQKARDTMLGAGSLAFAKFNLPQKLNQDTVSKEIELAVDKGRANFAAVEAKLYESVRMDTTNRPGRPPMLKEIADMIDRMQTFTRCRLEMEYHFDILSALVIAPTAALRFDPLYDDKEQLAEAISSAQSLFTVLEKISDTAVLGEPSTDDSFVRLKEVLAELRKGMSTSSDQPASFTNVIWQGRTSQIQEFLGREVTKPARGIIDQIREAVHLAGNYCNLQREALLNKLSRAYQKPDFCIRRDAVGPHRDALLPMDLSWDEYWYFGKADPEAES